MIKQEEENSLFFIKSKSSNLNLYNFQAVTINELKDETYRNTNIIPHRPLQ